MSETDASRSKRNFLTEPAIVASLIGGLAAVAAAVVPPLLSASRHESTPAAPTVLVSPVIESHSLTAAVPQPAVPQPVVAAKAKPNLTYGSWTLHSSRDDSGLAWDNSVIKFTEQKDSPDGLELVGFFEWRENGVFVGREHFVAHYVDDTRHLFMEGQRIEQPPEGRLGVGSFSAELSADARRLTDGTWGTVAGNQDGIPGNWEARR